MADQRDRQAVMLLTSLSVLYLVGQVGIGPAAG
jgi:hypothetical protein